MTTTINAAGGDYHGLPTAPVQYRGRRQHTGLDWDALNEQYTARGGQVDASVWPKTNGRVVVLASNARSSSRNVHSFAEADEYDETASAAPMRVTRPTRGGTQPGAKLTHEQRVTLGRRYTDGESLPELAKDYGVSVTLVAKILKALEVPTRSRIEAGKVRRAKRSAS